MGADGIELDTHATRDGTLVVHHDPDIDGRRIDSLSDDDLSALRLTNGETIPHLDEVLQQAGPMRVYVEVKALAPAWDRRLLETLDGGPAPERYAVHSFDHRVIARLGRLRPGLARGILLCSRPVDPAPLLTATGATTVWQERQQIDADYVTQVRTLGAALIAWTVDDENDMRRLQHLAVDGICGNHPDRLRAVLGADRG
jgi:glycerophosphoryl diester phosphodiesterase